MWIRTFQGITALCRVVILPMSSIQRVSLEYSTLTCLRNWQSNSKRQHIHSPQSRHNRKWGTTCRTSNCQCVKKLFTIIDVCRIDEVPTPIVKGVVLWARYFKELLMTAHAADTQSKNPTNNYNPAVYTDYSIAFFASHIILFICGPQAKQTFN